MREREGREVEAWEGKNRGQWGKYIKGKDGKVEGKGVGENKTMGRRRRCHG